jgi:hypothetical protein
MPLNRGGSNRTREANIAAEVRAGKPVAQAVAIGYSEQRRSKHMAKKSGEEMGHHGKHSAGMGTDGGADGSHESTRHGKQQNAIHTGHPAELERFHKTDGNNR